MIHSTTFQPLVLTLLAHNGAACSDGGARNAELGLHPKAGALQL
jgi:hypothetical protein